jgi:hypothetical protein
MQVNHAVDQQLHQHQCYRLRAPLLYHHTHCHHITPPGNATSRITTTPTVITITIATMATTTHGAIQQQMLHTG